MFSILDLVFVAFVAVVYGGAYVFLYSTQSKREPRLPPTVIPYLDPPIGIAKEKVNYLVNLRMKYKLPIFTLRMPFQRLYVVNAAELIRIIQAKTNLGTFVPNLLDFGLLFSGVNKETQEFLRSAAATQGNSFTVSVHKFLAQGPTLQVATRTAVDRLAASVRNSFGLPRINQVGLLEIIRHDLMRALTGAIYGPENPYDDPEVEASWQAFVPGITHLLYSVPRLTARKALRARSRIHIAFTKYFETGGHHQAFAMIPEIFEWNRRSGISLPEAAKLEMATSLAMLSSGAITAFWLLFHICSNPEVLEQCRAELAELVSTKTESTADAQVKVVDLSLLKKKCPTMIAMLNETLRYHSTLINIKKVDHNTTLAGQYLLKKDAIIMIPGTAVHHDPEIWGPSATTFDHRRLATSEGQKKLQSTLSFRPFGAGSTMCPGRHFSTNVMLSLVAIVLLQFDIKPAEGRWVMPTKWKADLWNAMPKPDADIPVRINPRESVQAVHWKFVWGDNAGQDADAKQED
ncbi:cytochrome P450 [Lentithecium fluviatile CBS 122367]|uniref:Cytochrome P450 n=1 Tax=Lentithecium fluviatile CBS 122367 TaxID=1168545 RepID=A0A6G1IND9_9PLEO|nr:cytochrome P450 [Lentithecium fluviatile CBS 122367]